MEIRSNKQIKISSIAPTMSRFDHSAYKSVDNAIGSTGESEHIETLSVLCFGAKRKNNYIHTNVSRRWHLYSTVNTSAKL